LPRIRDRTVEAGYVVRGSRPAEVAPCVITARLSNSFAIREGLRQTVVENVRSGRPSEHVHGNSEQHCTRYSTSHTSTAGCRHKCPAKRRPPTGRVLKTGPVRTSTHGCVADRVMLKVAWYHPPITQNHGNVVRQKKVCLLMANSSNGRIARPMMSQESGGTWRL